MRLKSSSSSGDVGLVGDGEQVEHGVGRAAECRGQGDRVLERLLRHDPTRREPEAEHLDDGLAGAAGISLAPAVDRRRRCRAEQAHPEALGDRAHRVGGEHPAAGTFAGARLAFDLEQLGLADRAGRTRTDGLEDARDVEGDAVVLAGQDRAVVDEHAGQVESGRGHQHAGDRLVAAGEADEPVEAFGVDDGLDRVADHLTGHERRPHPLVAHRDAVADRDGAELEADAAGGAHARLGVLGEFAERHVARGDLVPRRGDADLRLDPVVVGQADGAEHRT